MNLNMPALDLFGADKLTFNSQDLIVNSLL